MPANKDFKRLVRGRMQKTGESYTAARAQLLKQKPRRSPTAVPPAAADYAKLAGRSDAILKARTGCTWERWVKALDSRRRTPGPTGRSRGTCTRSTRCPAGGRRR